jgi:hypothetical protein
MWWSGTGSNCRPSADEAGRRLPLTQPGTYTSACQDRRAISGPLATATRGQSRPLRSIGVASSAALTAVRYTPSKLVMRIRFSSPALSFSPPPSRAATARPHQRRTVRSGSASFPGNRMPREDEERRRYPPRSHRTLCRYGRRPSAGGPASTEWRYSGVATPDPPGRH